jgi:WD40 repeat protein
MRRWQTALFCYFGVLVASLATVYAQDRGSPPAEPKLTKQEKPHTDRYGDPLPPGAIARLGTTRLRHRDYICSITFSADGTEVIAGSPLTSTGDSDKAIKVWSVATGKEIRQFGIRMVPGTALGALGGGGPSEVGISGLTLTRDGKTLATENGDGTASLWEYATGKEIRKFKPDDGADNSVRPVALSADGKLLACSGPNSIQLWDVAKGKRLRQFGNEESPVAFSPAGDCLASANEKGIVRLWHVESGAQAHEFADAGRTLAFSPNGKLLAAGGKDKQIRLWELPSGRALPPLQGHSAAISAIAFSPDGKLLASGTTTPCGISRDPPRLWDLASRKEVRRFAGHWPDVNALTFSPDGKTLAGGLENVVMLWDVETGKELHVNDSHRSPIWSLAISPDGKTLASTGSDDRIRLWDVSQARLLRSIAANLDIVGPVSFSPDGKTLLAGGSGSTVGSWDAATGRELHQFWPHFGHVYNVVFSPNGSLFVTSGSDGAFRLWNSATYKEVRQLQGPGRPETQVNTVAFSPDGKLLAACHWLKQASFWDVASGKEIGPRFDIESPEAVAFSPRGDLLALTGGNPAEIYLLDMQTRKTIRTLVGHERRIRWLSFSANGKILVSGSEDQTVRLWEVASGKELTRFRGHNEEISALAFSSTGKFVASGSRDSTILIWDVAAFLGDGRK